MNDGKELMPLQQDHPNIQLEDKDLESVHLIHSEQNQQILATEKPQVGLFQLFENSWGIHSEIKYYDVNKVEKKLCKG